MDPNLLKNLGLDGLMNQTDLNLISQLLNQSGDKNKLPKMSAKDKNNLINKLSSTSTLKELPQKELKDMNDDEKKIYREELRIKLKNKQNEKKMLRTNNFGKSKDTQKEALSKLSGMMKNIQGEVLENLNNQSDNLNNVKNKSNTNETDTNETDTNGSDTNKSDTKKIQNIDKINYLINKNYQDENNDKTEDIFDDYIK